MAKAVETEQQKKDRETVESIANNISALAGSVRALLNGKLKQKALVILLAHSSGIPQYQVANLLTALSTLEKDWLN